MTEQPETAPIVLNQDEPGAIELPEEEPKLIRTKRKRSPKPKKERKERKRKTREEKEPVEITDPQVHTIKQNLILKTISESKDQLEAQQKIHVLDRMEESEILATAQVDSIRDISALFNLAAQKIAFLCGAVLDKILKGQGKIKENFNQDRVLHSCIVQELFFLQPFLNNKTKIGVCALSDTIEGYNQSRSLPPETKPAAPEPNQ